MTADELKRKLTVFDGRTRDVETRICNQARGLIPVLRDAGREHSAKLLDELFFEKDAIDQEVAEILRVNPEQLLALLIRLGR